MGLDGALQPIVLYDASGNALAVQNGVATPANTPGVHVMGSDGTNSRFLSMDPQSGSQVLIDWAHRQTHQGNNFVVNYINTGFTGAGGLLDYLIITANNAVQPHLAIGAAILADSCTANIYEAPTTTSNGVSAASIWNKNRNSAATPTMAIWNSPTVTGVGNGALLSRIILPGQPWVLDRNNDELILKPNTKYLVRFTKTSNGTTSLNYEFNWHEGV